jgi:hypothetical protein
MKGSFWELGGGQIGKKGGGKQKIPPNPTPKRKKKPPHHPPRQTKNPSHPIPKRKKTSPSRGHDKPSHRLQEISFSKFVGQHGFPRLCACGRINFFSIFAFVSF